MLPKRRFSSRRGRRRAARARRPRGAACRCGQWARRRPSGSFVHPPSKRIALHTASHEAVFCALHLHMPELSVLVAGAPVASKYWADQGARSDWAGVNRTTCGPHNLFWGRGWVARRPPHASQGDIWAQGEPTRCGASLSTSTPSLSGSERGRAAEHAKASVDDGCR